MQDFIDGKSQENTLPHFKDMRLWLFTCITLSIFIVIAVSYIFYQNQRIRDLNHFKIDSQQRIEKMTKTDTPDTIVQPINLTTTISSFTQSMNRAGWMKYKNESLGISFEYPIELVELKNLSQTSQMETVNSVTLISKKDRDVNGRMVEILSFDNRFSPHTYGDQSVPDSVERDKYTVQGKKYDALQYVMGDGSRCGGSSISTDAIRLKEDLTIYKLSIRQERNTDQDTCEGDSYDIYKTPDSILKLVDVIIGTVEF